MPSRLFSSALAVILFSNLAISSNIISDVAFREKYFPENFWKFSEAPETYV